jgi:hypothetical protein
MQWAHVAAAWRHAPLCRRRESVAEVRPNRLVASCRGGVGRTEVWRGLTRTGPAIAWETIDGGAPAGRRKYGKGNISIMEFSTLQSVQK